MILKDASDIRNFKSEFAKISILMAWQNLGKFELHIQYFAIILLPNKHFYVEINAESQHIKEEI
jgi:hypothetical protein